ncbi:MAG: signal transduction histidine kinase/ligand-binding sensor domain-containing protein [Verrucomicrobiales bacterium]
MSPDQRELWIGAKRGISVIDANGARIHTPCPSMPDAELLAMGLAKDGTVWLGTMFGLYKGTMNSFEPVLTPASTDRHLGDYCRSIHRDRQGKLYAATRSGAYLIHNPERPEAKLERVLPSPDCRFAFKDSENQLWIGTDESLVRIDENIKWITRGDVSSISAGKDTIHFVAKPIHKRYKRSAFRYGGDKAKKMPTYSNLWAVFQHSNGDTWLSHDQGTTILRDNNTVQMHEHPDWPEDHITRFFEDTDGSVWMTTGSSGIFHYHNQQVTNYQIRDSLPGNDVRAIARDNYGRLWIGTISGLAFLKDLKITHLTARDGLISPFINDLLQGHDGTFWIATDKGLQSLQDGVIKDTFTTREGLLSDSVKALAEDKHGHLWIGTESGANRYDGQSMQSLIPADGIPRGQVKHLQSSPFGMVIGTSRGCVIYQTNRFHTATGKQPSEISFLSSDPTLKFALWGVSHKTRQNGMVRRYRFPGVMNEWQSTTKSFIDLPKLPTGDHSLEFQFIDRDLNYSAVEKIPIAIRRDYGIIARIAFLAAAIAAALIFGILYVSRNRAIRKANRELEDRVEERTRQLQEETQSRLQTEKEKHLVHQQLQQAQKMDALGTLSSGIAHDFNNSLCAISNLAELARIEGNPDSRREFLENIIEASEQASDITRSLLTFGRKGDLETKPCDLVPIVRRSVKLVQRLIPATIQIETQLPNEPIFCKIDPSNMQQVLINLAVNARDAMEDSEKKTLTFALDRHDDKARLTISDTGSGMTDQTKERLFEPFFTSKSRGKGTGLGLSIVHGIVAKLSGKISIESKEEKGTSFLIDLPLCPVPVPESKAIYQNKLVDTSASLAGKCVLIAEDEPHVRKVIVATLKREGYRIIEAADGVEALTQFHKHVDEIDLVICDFDMPHRNGLSSLRAMHAERPDMPTILCSGLAQPSVDDSHEVPLRFLQKPFSITAISALARELIQGETQDQLTLSA